MKRKKEKGVKKDLSIRQLIGYIIFIIVLMGVVLYFILGFVLCVYLSSPFCGTGV